MFENSSTSFLQDKTSETYDNVIEDINVESTVPGRWAGGVVAGSDSTATPLLFKIVRCEFREMGTPEALLFSIIIKIDTFFFTAPNSKYVVFPSPFWFKLVSFVKTGLRRCRRAAWETHQHVMAGDLPLQVQEQSTRN